MGLPPRSQTWVLTLGHGVHLQLETGMGLKRKPLVLASRAMLDSSKGSTHGAEGRTAVHPGPAFRLRVLSPFPGAAGYPLYSPLSQEVRGPVAAAAPHLPPLSAQHHR